MLFLFFIILEKLLYMSHSVEIKDEIYDEIKEFCKINNLKINKFINEIVQKQFMIEKYGDAPFINFGKKILEDNNQVQKQYEEIISAVGGSDKYNEMVSDLIFDDGGDKEQDDYDEINVQLSPKEEPPIVKIDADAQKVIDEHMKALEKKNNQSTKRRLKSK